MPPDVCQSSQVKALLPWESFQGKEVASFIRMIEMKGNLIGTYALLWVSEGLVCMNPTKNGQQSLKPMQITLFSKHSLFKAPKQVQKYAQAHNGQIAAPSITQGPLSCRPFCVLHSHFGPAPLSTRDGTELEQVLMCGTAEGLQKLQSPIWEDF